MKPFHAKYVHCDFAARDLKHSLSIFCVHISSSSQRHRGSGATADSRHQQPRHHQVDPARLGACEQIQVLPALLHHDGLRACCQRGEHHYPRNKWVTEGVESTPLGCVYVHKLVVVGGWRWVGHFLVETTRKRRWAEVKWVTKPFHYFKMALN